MNAPEVVIAHLVHAFAAALWLGSIFYSATQLHPRTPKIIKDQEAAEQFLLSITHGNRYRVMTAMVFVGFSGLALWLWNPPNTETLENAYWSKVFLMCMTFCAFVYTSWVLYPKRIFADIKGIEKHRRMNSIARWTMLCTISINFAVGILVHLL
jgi:uncharacterized membrane protein